MRCVQRRARPRPLHLNLFPTSTPPLINYHLWSVTKGDWARLIFSRLRKNGLQSAIAGCVKSVLSPVPVNNNVRKNEF